MKNHWTYYLPDWGRHYRVNTIKSNNETIADLQNRINRLIAENLIEESYLLADIKKHWSDQEIEDAKIKSTNE